MMPDAREPSAIAPQGGGRRLRYPWYCRMAAVLFATFCLEVGFFLLIFPWTDGAADFANFALPRWRAWWDNPFMKGAVSGLGVVNLYIAFGEVLRLRRFAGTVAVNSPDGPSPSRGMEERSSTE